MTQTAKTGVTILMATYNGQRFLSQQLYSIVGQTFTDWHLVVADDASTDDTPEQLQRFQEQFPGRVTILPTVARLGSARDNFLRLIRDCPHESSYFVLCDQDDVWFPHKLETLVAACAELERCRSSDTACLAYSDLTVVDKSLRVLAPSFMAEIQTDPRNLTFEQVLLENSIPGSAMLCNYALIDSVRAVSLSGQLPIMHDWWLALVAMGTGSTVYVPQPLGMYRQHGNNVAGSVHRSGAAFVANKLKELRNSRYPATIQQAKLLLSHYRESLNPEQMASLKAYCSIRDLPKRSRFITAWKHGLVKQTFPRQIQEIIQL